MGLWVTSEKNKNKMFHYDPKHSLFYYARPYLCFPIRTPCPEVGLKSGGKMENNFFILVNFVVMTFDVRRRYPGIIFDFFDHSTTLMIDIEIYK